MKKEINFLTFCKWSTCLTQLNVFFSACLLKFSSYFRLVKVFQLHLVKIWRHSSLQELCLHWLIAMEIFSGKAGKTSWIVCFSCLRPKCCQSLWWRWGKTSLVERFFSVQSQQRLSVQWANQNLSRIRAASIKRGKKFASKSWLFGACEISDYNRRRFCSRLHGVLYVSIVYPPNWRIMVHLLFSSAWLVWAHQSITLPLRLGFEILGRFPFVRTDWPGHSLRNENFTFNESYPARSVKCWILCTNEIVFHQKRLEKAYFILKMSGAALVRPASSDIWKAL